MARYQAAEPTGRDEPFVRDGLSSHQRPAARDELELCSRAVATAWELDGVTSVIAPGRHWLVGTAPDREPCPLRVMDNCGKACYNWEGLLQ